MNNTPLINVTYLDHQTGDVIYHASINAKTSKELSSKIRSRTFAPLDDFCIRRHHWSLNTKTTPIGFGFEYQGIVCWCYRK
jgi:hypothetical protein